MNDLLIDCSLGLSGDMLLAALVDLGIPIEEIKSSISLMDLEDEFSLEVKEIVRNGFRGLSFSVHGKSKGSSNRTFKEIKLLVENSRCSQNLKKRILKVFFILASAEAVIHGKDLDEVHFHEVGETDSLIDIIGVCAAIEYLKVRNIVTASPPAGKGYVLTKHGGLPIPVPAVLEIAKNYNIKLTGSLQSYEGELTTPTGIALLASLTDGFCQPSEMEICNIGIGIGQKDFGRPNFLRVCLINSLNNEVNESLNKNIDRQNLIVQEAWIDDSSPEELAAFISDLRKSGAIDVACFTIQMKKGRQGFEVKAIVSPEDSTRLRSVWFSNGISLGIREYAISRWVLPRRLGFCTTSLGKVRFKQFKKPDGTLIEKPEYDELYRLSNNLGKSMKEINSQIIKSSSEFSPDSEWSW